MSESNAITKIKWAIVGATGFVGSGIVEALAGSENAAIKPVKSPRLHCDSDFIRYSDFSVFTHGGTVTKAVTRLEHAFRGVDVVVNAAGVAAPDGSGTSALYGANALLPAVVAQAAKDAGVRKLLHISSIAVQGTKEVLDESPYVRPFSAYSHSKALGEHALNFWDASHNRSEAARLAIVIIRATSVQGAARRTTETLKRIASSFLASVAYPGTQPSIVSSLAGLAYFVAAVGSYRGALPRILIQPWEGATVREVMQLAGKERNPILVPATVARIGVSSLRAVGVLHPRFVGLARRLEVMWFGQRQVAGWAVTSGIIDENANGATLELRRVLQSPNIESRSED